MKWLNTRKKKSEGEKKARRNRITEPKTTSKLQMRNINLSRKNHIQDKFWNTPVEQLIPSLSLENTEEGKSARQKWFKNKTERGMCYFH